MIISGFKIVQNLTDSTIPTEVKVSSLICKYFFNWVLCDAFPNNKKTSSINFKTSRNIKASNFDRAVASGNIQNKEIAIYPAKRETPPLGNITGQVFKET